MKKFFEEHGAVAIIVIVIAVLLVLVGSVKGLNESNGKVNGTGIAGVVGNKLSDSVNKFQKSFDSIDGEIKKVPTTGTLAISRNLYTSIPDSATKVVFTDLESPSNVSVKDLTKEHNSSIVGWLEGTTYYISFQDKNESIKFENACDAMLKNRSNLQYIDFSNIFVEDVSTFENAFYGCSSLKNIDLSKFHTSSLTTMNNMFYGCNNLETIKFGINWDTKNLKFMDTTFCECVSLKTIDLTPFLTTNLKSLTSTFYGCHSLEIIYVSPKWDIPGVLSFPYNNATSSTFCYCYKLFGPNNSYNSQQSTSGKYATYDTGYLTLR